MKNRDIDALLRQALCSAETPDTALIQKIKSEYREDYTPMKRTTKKPFALVAAIAALVLLSTTVFAAWNLLKPSEVADKFENTTLAAAFESETAVNINKSISAGEYKFNLLAMVSGKDLSDWPYYNDDEIKSDRTYVIFALEYADGRPMPNTWEDPYGDITFFATPLVKGTEPTMMNAVMMNGGGQTITIDGIMYRIIECDNMEIYADKGLVFAINDGVFFNPDAYLYDEATGEITANPDYSGISAVFDLPVDPALGDPEAAAQYEADLAARNEQRRQATPPPEMAEIQTMLDGIDWDNAVEVDSTFETELLDDGTVIHCTYEYESGSGSITTLYAETFTDEVTEQTAIISMMTSDDQAYAVRVTKSVDGTVRGAIVVPAE